MALFKTIPFTICGLRNNQFCLSKKDTKLNTTTYNYEETYIDILQHLNQKKLEFGTLHGCMHNETKCGKTFLEKNILNKGIS